MCWPCLGQPSWWVCPELQPSSAEAHLGVFRLWESPSYATRRLDPLVTQEHTVLHAPHGRVRSCRAAQVSSAKALRLRARSWGLAGPTLHSSKPRAVKQWVLRLLELFHLCLMQGAWKSFKASAELQILMFLALENLNGRTVPKKCIWKTEPFSQVRNQSGIWRKAGSKSVRVFHLQLNPNCVTGKF